MKEPADFASRMVEVERKMKVVRKPPEQGSADAMRIEPYMDALTGLCCLRQDETPSLSIMGRNDCTPGRTVLPTWTLLRVS